MQVLQVSNNRYHLRNLTLLGERERLDAGLLQDLGVVRAHRRQQAIPDLWSLATGGSDARN